MAGTKHGNERRNSILVLYLAPPRKGFSNESSNRRPHFDFVTAKRHIRR
jgi:hypothetical protein